MPGGPIAFLGSLTDQGGTVTLNVSLKVTVAGGALGVAKLGSLVTYTSGAPDTIMTKTSTRVIVDGVPAALVGSMTVTKEDTVITGFPTIMLVG